jgi:hypothetical protein
MAKVIHFIATAKFPTQKNKVFANFCILKLRHSVKKTIYTSVKSVMTDLAIIFANGRQGRNLSPKYGS